MVTTTNSIEGREISRYNDPIVANVVIGTNIFSDIGASYIDFFGGSSTSYEKKMQEMFKPSHFNGNLVSLEPIQY
ncbi:YbjQ family protein [Sphingobacterium siyangense]|uniref:YbjQ family protein n=1 Tax=Sphingobacterium siyangense TaxID=459529 RepID=UPI0034E0119A